VSSFAGLLVTEIFHSIQGESSLSGAPFAFVRLQRRTPALVDALIAQGYRVSIETHGEAPIASVASRARIIMDIKTPGSGMCRGGYERNLAALKPSDEVKFVICSPEDYIWARELVRSGRIPVEVILFSPVVPAAGSPSPASVPGVDPTWLAERILEDRLPVRLQLQLHKILWGANRRGV
jgi:7-carboxy-7-deazaguanine synthase